MISPTIIEEVVMRLVKTYHPQAIYLFGSYAWGNPSDESDLDLMVIVEKSDQSRFERPVKGLLALCGLGISKDLLVRTKKEFDQGSLDQTTLLAKIRREGKMLYGKL